MNTQDSPAVLGPVQPTVRPQGSVRAVWRIELTCTCPVCSDYVDLLEHPDFWDGRSDLQAGENCTPRTRVMDVTCPKCDAEFTVDCDY